MADRLCMACGRPVDSSSATEELCSNCRAKRVAAVPLTTDSAHEAPIVPGEASAEDLRKLNEFICDPDWERADLANLLETIAYLLDRHAATPSAPPADLEAESRELLAEELRVAGCPSYAGDIERGFSHAPSAAYRLLNASLRAIQRALSARQIAQGVDDDARDFARYVAKLPCETKGNEDLEGGCCGPCRARAFLAAPPPPSVEADAMVEEIAALIADDCVRDWSFSEDAPEDAYEKAVAEQTPFFRGIAAKIITRLSGGEVERLREALEPFAKALGDIAGPDKTRWPDQETIEHSGAAELITWGDLRRARTAIQGESRD